MNLGIYKHDRFMDVVFDVRHMEQEGDKHIIWGRWMVNGTHNSWYCPAPGQKIVIGEIDLPKWEFCDNLKPMLFTIGG